MANSSNDKNTKETRTHDSNPVDFSSESEFEELEEPKVIEVLDLDNSELRKMKPRSKVDDFSSESDTSQSSKVTHKKENQSNKFSSESNESSVDSSSEVEKYIPSQDHSSESDDSSFENAKENNKRHKCRTCEKSFCSRRSLKRHLSCVHDKIKPYTYL